MVVVVKARAPKKRRWDKADLNLYYLKSMFYLADVDNLISKVNKSGIESYDDTIP